MITLLSVSQGTRVVDFNIQQGEIFVGTTPYIVKGEFCAVLPGAGSIDFKQADPGYLRQGGEQNGQKDVDHLDLDGTIVMSSNFDSIGSFFRNTTYPSVYGSVVGQMPVTRGSYSAMYQPMFLLAPYAQGGVTAGYSACRSNPVGSWSADCYFSLMGMWFGYHDLFTGYCNVRSDTWKDGVLVAGYVYRFNGDFSRYSVAYFSKRYKGLPVGANWQDYLNIAGDDLYKVAISLTPADSTLNFYSTSKGSVVDLDKVHVPKFERADLFAVDLNPDWGSLASDCYSQVQLWNGNGGAYVRDFVGMGKAAKDTIRLMQDLLSQKNPIAVLKDIASIFLSFRYGWYLTAKDTVSMVKTDYDRLYLNGRVKRSSSRTYVRNGITVVARCSVYCRPYSNCVSDLERWLKLMDFDMTLENVWDLVPLSFVVDWFTGLGEIFNRMDQLAKLDQFDIFLTGQSLKASVVVPATKVLPAFNAMGLVSATFYKRRYTTTPIKPSIISYQGADQPTGFAHWLEGISLVVQRL